MRYCQTCDKWVDKLRPCLLQNHNIDWSRFEKKSHKKRLEKIADNEKEELKRKFDKVFGVEEDEQKDKGSEEIYPRME